MVIQEKMNQKYTHLCQQLGDLTLKQEKIEAQIQTIKDELQTVLDLTPELVALEQNIRSEHENKRCTNCTCASGLPDDGSGDEGRDQEDSL